MSSHPNTTRHSSRLSSSSTSSSSSIPSSSRTVAESIRPSHSRASSRDYITGGIPSPTIRPPPRSVTAQRRHQQQQMRVQYDAMGAFFGGGRVVQPQSPPPSRASQEAERSARQSEETMTTQETYAAHAPPPYACGGDLESLPTYSINGYSAELNRKLFLYGFVFFPLWIVGIIAPFVKPQRDPSRDNKTKEQAIEEDRVMRAAEMKWAWRCFFALLTLIVTVTIAIVVGVTVASKT